MAHEFFRDVTVETLSPDLQPDQQPTRWDDYVSLYEAVFEPLTNAFAARALDALRVGPGLFCLDVGAGSGGAGHPCSPSTPRPAWPNAWPRAPGMPIPDASTRPSWTAGSSRSRMPPSTQRCRSSA